MEEAEVPVEHLQEHVQHHAQPHVAWTMAAALTTCLLAALAAVTALLSGHHANEGMLDQLNASDKWSYYQAKGIKAAVLNAKLELLVSLDKPADPKDLKKVADYAAEQQSISKEAKEKEKAVQFHMKVHVIFARGVTLFQVAIAVSAIAVLTKRKRFWFVGLVFGLIGVGFLVQGLLTAP
jgi:hypothetical protein